MTANSAPAATGATIQLPDAPPIPGLRFRHYRGPEDHADLVRVANAHSASVGESRVKSVAEQDNDFAHPVNMDPERDVIVAEVDGRMVGWGQVDWVDQNWGGRSYNSWGAVDPDWQRRGIGGAMLAHNERRLHAVGAADGYEGPRWLSSWGPDDDTGMRALMDREGYIPVRHFYLMVRPSLEDVPELPLPDGIEVRPVTAAHSRQLYDADIDAFKDHWGGIEDSEETFRQWTESPSFDPSLCVVAWDGDQIVAGVVGGIYPEENAGLGVLRGFLDQVFTRRAWRRRGIARALIARSLVLFRERGMTTAALGVDASNPNAALPLYESCGFAAAERATAYRKPWDPSVGPEWESLDEPAL